MKRFLALLIVSLSLLLGSANAVAQALLYITSFGACATCTAAVNITAIQKAVDYGTTLSTGATVIVPAGSFAISSPIAMKAGVNIVGYGPTVSIIAPASSGAFTYAFTQGYGESRIADLGIVGSGTSGNQIAIYQAGTTSQADELYGITLDRVHIANFDIAVKLRTVRVLRITGNWWRNINSGLVGIGKVLNVYIAGNRIERATAQSGTADVWGIHLDAYTYAGPTTVGPEGIRIVDNEIFSFQIAVNANFSTFLNVHSNDIAATIYGVRLSSWQGVTNITGNYIEIDGAGSLYGVYVTDQSAPGNRSPVNIAYNRFLSDNSGISSNGVRLGTAAGGYASNVNILYNVFSGWTGPDIETYRSSGLRIIGNLCNSSVPVNSIYIGSMDGTGDGSGPVFVDQNRCVGAIAYDPTSPDAVQLGRIQLGANIVSSTTKQGFLLQGSATFNPSNLADGAGETTTVTVTGAALGDFVDKVSFSLDLQGITVTAWVSAADTVSVRFQNETGGGLDLASGTLRASVRQKTI